MATGSIHPAGKVRIKFSESYALRQTYTAGANLKMGQPVKVSGDGIVEAVSAVTDFCIGIVDVEGVTGERVTVLTNFTADQLGVAKGGALVAGGLVVADGTLDANDTPNFVAAVAGNFASHVVLVGGAGASEVRVGMLRTPFVVQ